MCFSLHVHGARLLRRAFCCGCVRRADENAIRSSRALPCLDQNRRPTRRLFRGPRRLGRCGASAPFDLLGIAAAIVCVFLPWPTCIFRILTLWWEEFQERRNGKIMNDVWYLNLRGASLAIYCLLSSLAEMPFAVVSLVIGLVTPTRTMATCRVFGNHLYYRASPNVYWSKLFGEVKYSYRRPALLVDSILMICFSVLDWITAPPLVVVVFLGTKRLTNMNNSSLSNQENSRGVSKDK